jgi:hypothetical protein
MMNWWKGFKDWLTAGPEYSVLKDWEPSNILYLPSAPQEPAAWSDANLKLADAVVTVGLPNTTDGESDLSSDEKNEPGGEKLAHADDLPSATYRVFPTRADNRNGYDSPESVERAIAARNRRPYHYDAPGGIREPIRVYQAETVWRDVTDEYVQP